MLHYTLRYQLDEWDKAYAKASLKEIIKAKMGGPIEDACLLLLRDPVDEYCNAIKEVSSDLHMHCLTTCMSCTFDHFGMFMSLGC